MSEEEKKVEPQEEKGLVQYSNPFRKFLGYLERLKDSIKNKSWKSQGTRFTDTILALVRVEVGDKFKEKAKTLANERNLLVNAKDLDKVLKEYAKEAIKGFKTITGNFITNSDIIDRARKENHKKKSKQKKKGISLKNIKESGRGRDDR